MRTFNTAVPGWLESVVMRAIEKDKNRRYEVYSEMEYELTHPDKVKPYYNQDASLIEREPVKVYKSAFIVSFLINIVLLFLLLK